MAKLTSIELSLRLHLFEGDRAKADGINRVATGHD